MLKFNGKVMKFGNVWGAAGSVIPPGPVFEEVTIGTQTWMAKNLAVDDGGEGIVRVDDVTANGVNFGTQYYYTYDAAERVAASIEGWHLPSYDEWRSVLLAYTNYNTTPLKSTSGWSQNNGTNELGFNCAPVGSISNGSHINLGTYCLFIATPKSWSLQYSTYRFSPPPFVSSSNNIANTYINSTADDIKAYPVRLVKDA